MATYRFIGDVALFHIDGRDIQLTEFGQSVELTDEQAKLEVGQRIPLLNEVEWKRIGITDKEISSYPTSAEQRLAPVSFTSKKQKALDLFVQKLVALYQPAAPETPTAAPEQVQAPIAQDPQPQESK